mmetsp:Transcript_20312/g.59341  ORF Transcript_20312/g.59341 Transcript_20312/m.59341 type:complete len:206 (-) Transcript_20312:295-912(-)
MPVLGTVLDAPTIDGDDVVRRRVCSVLGNASRVVVDGCGIDRASNRPPGIDLSQHVLLARNSAIFRDGGVREHIDGGAVDTKGGARAASVDRRAGRVHGATEALRGIGAAGQIGLARVVGHVPRVLDKLVCPTAGTAVARTCDIGTTVQDPLDAEVNVDSLATSGDLDAVCEGTHGSVGPAASTVLWDMLIQILRQIADAIHLGP